MRACWLPVLVGFVVWRPAFGCRVKLSMVLPAKERFMFHVCFEVLTIERTGGVGVGIGLGNGGIGGGVGVGKKNTHTFAKGVAVLERHTPGRPAGLVVSVI